MVLQTQHRLPAFWLINSERTDLQRAGSFPLEGLALEASISTVGWSLSKRGPSHSGKTQDSEYEEVLVVWLFPVPGAIDTMGGLAGKTPCLGFAACWFSPSFLPIPVRVREGPVPSTDRLRMCFLLVRPLPGPHHKVLRTCRWSDAHVQWEIPSGPQDSGRLMADLTSTEVLWIFPSVWVKCGTLPLHGCL